MNIKYTLGALAAIPLLPVMYLQGKKIRANIPRLPEAKGTAGTATFHSDKALQLISIGESTIAGVGVENHEEGFTGTLARELALKFQADVHWKVYARSGYTAKSVRERIIPVIEEKTADLVVVGLGGNDAFTLNNPEKWRRQVQELIGEISMKFAETPVFFTNMPPIKEFPAFTPLMKFTLGNLGEILGEELEDLVRSEEGVYYNAQKITLKDWTARLPPGADATAFFSDGVHPSKLTYQIWAKDFSEFVFGKQEVRDTLHRRLNGGCK